MSFDFGISALVRRVHGRKDRKHAEFMRRSDWEHNYIGDRVAEAQAAGIHPLFALGASPSSSTPIQVDYGESDALAAEIGNSIRGYQDSQRQDRVDAGQRDYMAAQIKVLQSEAAKNDMATAQMAQSMLARSTQPSQPVGGPVIAPKGQVGTPGTGSQLMGQTERFGTPLGYVDANKRFADSEEVERRWGDLAQEIYGTGLFLNELTTNIHNKYSDYMDNLVNPKTRINSLEDWDKFQQQ